MESSLPTPQRPAEAAAANASSFSSIARSCYNDSVMLLFTCLSALIMVAIAAWDSAAIPALALMVAAGGGVVYAGHFRHRAALGWMDAPAQAVVHRQVLRQFAMGACGVTLLSMLIEGVLSVGWTLLAVLILRQDVKEASLELTASPGGAQHVTFFKVLTVAWTAFVVAAATEELGKAWAVRWPCRKRSGAAYLLCCCFCCGLGEEPASAVPISTGPAAPTATATATAAVAPSAAVQVRQQTQPPQSTVLQPRPHVPRVTIALFIAVAAGFSTAENLGYVFGQSSGTQQSPAPALQEPGLGPQRAALFAPHTPLQQVLHSPLWGAAEGAAVAPDLPSETWGERALGMLLFAGARVLLSLPVHVLCAMLTAFAFLKLDLQWAASTPAQRSAGRLDRTITWIAAMWPGVAVHGLFDFLLMLYSVVLPGRVGDVEAEIISLATAVVIVLAALALACFQWRGLRGSVAAYDRPLAPASSTHGTQGEYASLLGLGGGDEETGVQMVALSVPAAADGLPPSPKAPTEVEGSSS